MIKAPREFWMDVQQNPAFMDAVKQLSEAGLSMNVDRQYPPCFPGCFTPGGVVYKTNNGYTLSEDNCRSSYASVQRDLKRGK